MGISLAYVALIMAKLFLLFLLMGWMGAMSQASTREDIAVSAIREPGEDWLEALAKTGASSRGGKPLEYARPYSPVIDISALPEWGAGRPELDALFVSAREWRAHKDISHPEFPRRAAWLYPRDGCYAKASHIAKAAEMHGYVRPGKIFTFGYLHLKTPYDPRKIVYWTYHVASAYRLKGTAYVLDPAIESTRILTLDEWMTRIAFHPLQIKIAFCSSHTYSTESDCFATSSGDGYLTHMRQLLPLEWNALARMGYAPRQLLDNHPPWSPLQ